MEASPKVHPVAWIGRYFREAKEELEKVAWPSRRDTVRYTVLVIALSVGLAAVIAGLDWAFALGLEKLITVAK